METCKFSETQFSFCFTFEYIKLFYPGVMPVFPTLREEGKDGGGYDVEISGNIYFQFKRPKYYSGKKYHSTTKKWAAPDKNYYSIVIDKDQFVLLNTLKEKHPNSSVCYATPNFHIVNDLRHYYVHHSIISNSSIFPIENFPMDKSDCHELIYRPDRDYGFFFSEPVEISKASNLNPAILVQKANEEISLFEYTRKINAVLSGSQLKYGFVSDNNGPAVFIKQVHTALLFDFNIMWFPVSFDGSLYLL